jgi:cyclophilin family peptidyl-prolyl cis-trans isomerase
MSNKKTEMKLERRRRQARQKVIQYITIGIVAVVVVGLAWAIFSSFRQAVTVGGKCKVTTMQFTAPPPMLIDVKKQYFATVAMVKGGQFVIQLYPDKAPATVNNFVFLADKGFFSCVTFHRVIDGFMAQGGDPTGTGNGGPGYQIPDETNDLIFDKAGVVAMANTGQPNSGGSQFFITFAPQDYLNGGYTIFGQVISGMDVVNGLTRRDPTQNPSFSGDTIQSVTISEK